MEGTLLSGVFMQSPPKGSMYPTLDPEVHQPLEIYLYRGSKFGYVDSRSLAGLAKSKLTELYAKNYPYCIHKLPSNLLKQVNTDLITSYIDDLSLGTTLRDQPFHTVITISDSAYTSKVNW